MYGGDAARCARPVRPGVDDLSLLTFEESVFVFSGLSDIESVTQRILFLDSLFLLSFYQFFQLSLVSLCPCMMFMI